MFDCIGKGNNPGVYGVAVQFEKQSVHRSAEGLAFWRVDRADQTKWICTQK